MIKIQEKWKIIGTNPLGIQVIEFLNRGLKIILFDTFKDIKHKIEGLSRELGTRQKNW